MKWKRSKKTDGSSGKKGTSGDHQDAGSSSSENSDSNKNTSTRSQSNGQSSSYHLSGAGMQHKNESLVQSSGRRPDVQKNSMTSGSGMKMGIVSENCSNFATSSSSSPSASSVGLVWAQARHLAECGRSLPSTLMHNPISDKSLQEDPFYRPFVS